MLTEIGVNVPHDMMISIKAMSATGFWNQLYKVSHAAYLARHFIPFMLYSKHQKAEPWCRRYDPATVRALTLVQIDLL